MTQVCVFMMSLYLTWIVAQVHAFSKPPYYSKSRSSNIKDNNYYKTNSASKSGDLSQRQNEVNKGQVMDDKVTRVLYSMSREIKMLRTQMTTIKQQNHLIYTNMKKARNTCKPVPENSVNPCPADFVYNAGLRSCYKVVPERMSWQMAQNKCKEKKANLVSIESGEEQRYLIKQFQTSFETKHCNYWTSGTDRQNEGQWRWSGTDKPLSYTRWSPGEPNNGSVDEHCMHMLWYFKWRWNDARCSVDRSCYVCEIHYD